MLGAYFFIYVSPGSIVDTVTRNFKPVEGMREVWVLGKAVYAEDDVLWRSASNWERITNHAPLQRTTNKPE